MTSLIIGIQSQHTTLSEGSGLDDPRRYPTNSGMDVASQQRQRPRMTG
jgi:hypothetical protein